MANSRAMKGALSLLKQAIEKGGYGKTIKRVDDPPIDWYDDWNKISDNMLGGSHTTEMFEGPMPPEPNLHPNVNVRHIPLNIDNRVPNGQIEWDHPHDSLRVIEDPILNRTYTMGMMGESEYGDPDFYHGVGHSDHALIYDYLRNMTGDESFEDTYDNYFTHILDRVMSLNSNPSPEVLEKLNKLKY